MSAAEAGRRGTVAVLGTGVMGGPIATTLVSAGFPVRVWNRTAARAAPVVRAGATLADSPAEAATDADVVITMLAEGGAVHSVMTDPSTGALAAMRGTDTVWAQMSTVGMSWTSRLAGAAADHRVTFVDCPVLGSDSVAREGALLVLASGPDKAREKVRPVFDAVGGATRWLGAAGRGNATKTVLNNWLVCQVEAMAETLALATTLGLDPRMILDMLAGGPVDAPYARAKGAAMLDGRVEPGFALRLAVKDAALARDAARDAGLEVPFTDVVVRRWEQALDAGHGGEDIAAAGTVSGR